MTPGGAAGATSPSRRLGDRCREALRRSRRALARADRYDLAAMALLGCLVLLVAFIRVLGLLLGFTLASRSSCISRGRGSAPAARGGVS